MKLNISMENFLETGALIRLNKEEWIIGCGGGERSSDLSKQKQGFYVPDFDLKEPKPWLSFDHISYLTTEELKLFLKPLLNNKLLEKRLWIDGDKAAFFEDFTSIQSKILEGKIEKAVPISFEESSESLTKEERGQILQKLIFSEPHLYPYGYWTNEVGMIGLSPEVLFKIQGNELSTAALAGTKKSKDLKSLLDDQKQVAEHKFVIDDISLILKDFGLVKVASTKEWNVGYLSHIRTDFKCRLKEKIDFLKLVERFHPTSALGVSPKKENWNWFKDKISKKDRGCFGAPFGFYKNKSESICVVAIRNFSWKDKKTKVYSGCGIVKESCFKDEWIELEDKRQSVKNFFEL